MAGSGIPARGPGNGSPKAAPFTSEKARELGAKGNFVQEKMRKWREANPDAPLTMMERDRLYREAMREKTPDVLVAVYEVAVDNTHPDFKVMAPLWIKQDMGNPKQQTEITGKDGEAIEVNDVTNRIARKLAGLAAAGDTASDTGGTDAG